MLFGRVWGVEVEVSSGELSRKISTFTTVISNLFTMAISNTFIIKVISNGFRPWLYAENIPRVEGSPYRNSVVKRLSMIA